MRQIPVNVRFFERTATVGFPRDSEGKITALIHPSLQGKPELMEGVGVKIKPGHPIFQTIFKGEDILYGENTQPGQFPICLLITLLNYVSISGLKSP